METFEFVGRTRADQRIVANCAKTRRCCDIADFVNRAVGKLDFFDALIGRDLHAGEVDFGRFELILDRDLVSRVLDLDHKVDADRLMLTSAALKTENGCGRRYRRFEIGDCVLAEVAAVDVDVLANAAGDGVVATIADVNLRIGSTVRVSVSAAVPTFTPDVEPVTN